MTSQLLFYALDLKLGYSAALNLDALKKSNVTLY